MNSDVVKIGIIGCGWIAGNAHIPALKECEGASVTAVFDTDIQCAQTLADTYDISEVYDNLEGILSSGVDGVIIATPNFTHVQYTLEALEHGINVLCEKPVAFHVREMEEIIKTAKKNNVLYIPGFVNRWRQDIQILYETIKAGKIGEIQRVEAGWLRKYGVPRPGTWFTNSELSGGGVLVDLGSHVLDICLMFLEDSIPEEYNLTMSVCNKEQLEKAGEAGWFKRDDVQDYQIDVEDTAILDVKFKNEISLNVKLSWMAPVQADCTYFKIIGTKGEAGIKTLFGFSNERLWKEDILNIRSNGIHSNRKLDKKENNSKNAFREMSKYFVQCIRSQNTVFVSGKDAIKTVSLIENLYHNGVVDIEKVQESLLKE